MAIGGLTGNYASPSKTPASPSSSTLTMDSFMNLMAVQLQNQDMSNPMDNSEMMGQLTQMATVQAMNTFTELSTTQYAMSMVGQDVKVSYVNKETNKLDSKTGKVEGIDLALMRVYLKDDKNEDGYGLGNIMSIGTVPEKKEDPVKPGDDGTGDGTKPGDGTGDGTKPGDGTGDKDAKNEVSSRTSDIPADKAAYLNRMNRSTDYGKVNQSAASGLSGLPADKALVLQERLKYEKGPGVMLYKIKNGIISNSSDRSRLT